MTEAQEYVAKMKADRDGSNYPISYKDFWDFIALLEAQQSVRVKKVEFIDLQFWPTYVANDEEIAFQNDGLPPKDFLPFDYYASGND